MRRGAQAPRPVSLSRCSETTTADEATLEDVLRRLLRSVYIRHPILLMVDGLEPTSKIKAAARPPSAAVRSDESRPNAPKLHDSQGVVHHRHGRS